MYEDEKQLFEKIHGYPLDLDNPQTFSEKIVHKKLFDRNPLLPQTADKFKVRFYIRSKIDKANEHLIPLLWAGSNPEDIPFYSLPNEYIIKPNNACGRYIIAKEKKYIVDYRLDKYGSLNKDKIISICNKWLSEPYGVERYEWVYQKIKSMIIIEKLLKDNNGKIPTDYRFFMFNGKCKLISTSRNRLEGIIFTYYDENWNLFNIKRYGKNPLPEEKPESYNKMIEFAEILSSDFDFVRIDFYLVDDYIYFGEITHYPSSGDLGFFPKELDFKLGEYWRLK